MKAQKNNTGQGMTEYLIIVALIAVSAIGITSLTSNHVKVGFGRIANALRGEDKNPGKYDDIKETHTKSRDMGDFTEGVDR
jgi:Flp pilus assembly pilin Flp